jgi:protein archease
MPYRFLEDIAIADVAFEALGETAEEIFTAAADALLNVMVEDPEMVQEKEAVDISLESHSVEMLLFDFLNELIYYKDSRRLLLRAASAEISHDDGNWRLTAVASGEPLDTARHPLVVDVKAVTFHRFKVEESAAGWRAIVVLDI